MMWLYQILLLVGLLFYIPKAFLRKRLPHAGWFMRVGRYPAAARERLRGSRDAIWVHAVSVGENIAARPLIDELLRAYPGSPLVISTVTPTGFQVASKWLGERGTVIYAPLDVRPFVATAFSLIRPRLLVLVESELWPVLIDEARRRNVSVAIVNGRISVRAHRRYRMVRPFLRRMLHAVSLFLMQTPADADRAVDIGAARERVRVLGSMKWDASLMSRPSAEQVSALTARLALSPELTVVVAGSTHRGEEEALVEALQGIRGQLDRVRLIVAPRHPERVAEVEEIIRRRGLAVARVSQLRADAAWDVAIVDTLGQLPTFYALASVVFVGGSLIPHGGQNPIEPASLGKAILFGPWMHNFADIVEQLRQHHAARQLASRDELTGALLELLTDRAKMDAMGQRAQEITQRSAGCALRTREALAPLLDRDAARGL